ncbi:unnamed protein product [Bursaphelenchus okinawaensis]|uniref:Uncharacterized protein n=1 Tax=Bursaphelenchus okinawaensis TaxID=465554 RepID=A0A811KER9_9BILA|nr:unnamed protein product [Bursaphelenchus okinawaensis]CAG9103313.1 unnamed protein product [Bursaphelenchus okinawaensis]
MAEELEWAIAEGQRLKALHTYAHHDTANQQPLIMIALNMPEGRERTSASPPVDWSRRGGGPSFNPFYCSHLQLLLCNFF